MEVNEFFSRRDLGGVNPELLECELKLYNTKEVYKILQARVLDFYQKLRLASQIESREGEMLEYWAEQFKQEFGISEAREGKVE